MTAMLSEEAKVDSPYSTQTSPTVDRTTESLSKGRARSCHGSQHHHSQHDHHYRQHGHDSEQRPPAHRIHQKRLPPKRGPRPSKANDEPDDAMAAALLAGNTSRITVNTMGMDMPVQAACSTRPSSSPEVRRHSCRQAARREQRESRDEQLGAWRSAR